MDSGPIPFLWLCGPSGVGKSAVGWEIFSQLDRAGVRAGYVDLDQVGLCYPESPDDPGNVRVKTTNLAAVWPAFRDAAVRCFVVSGALDPIHARACAAGLPGAALTLCRLRAGRDVLRARFLRRGWRPDLVDEMVRDADELDREDVSDLRVDTDGLSIPEVGRLVRERAGGWPYPLGEAAGERVPATPARPVETGRVPLIWLCGPVGVGKSTIGYEVFTQILRAGVKAAYVDLAQIGFCRPVPDDDPDNHRFKARNLAAMWPAFRAAGARCLVVTGSVRRHDTVRACAGGIPGVQPRLCRLRAGNGELIRRILMRGQGGGPPIPGDELRGLPAGELRRIVERAVADADALERGGIGDVCVDTDDRSVEESARLVRTLTGAWPDPR